MAIFTQLTHMLTAVMSIMSNQDLIAHYGQEQTDTVTGTDR